jgi:hypothetical protein
MAQAVRGESRTTLVGASRHIESLRREMLRTDAGEDLRVVLSIAAAFIAGGETAMVTISLRPSPAGDWNIRRCGVTLFNDLSLVQAIRLARYVARDEYLRLRRHACKGDAGRAFDIRVGPLCERWR